LRGQGADVPDDLLAHVASIGREHIGLTADYIWTRPNPATPFRQLNLYHPTALAPAAASLVPFRMESPCLRRHVHRLIEHSARHTAHDQDSHPGRLDRDRTRGWLAYWHRALTAVNVTCHHKQ
jgi:hypothetical protein